MASTPTLTEFLVAGAAEGASGFTNSNKAPSIIASRRYRTYQSSLDIYSSLAENSFTKFNTLPASAFGGSIPVAGSLPATLPMIFRLVAPDVFPSGGRSQAVSPSPGPANPQLVGLRTQARPGITLGVAENQLTNPPTTTISVSDSGQALPNYLRIPNPASFSEAYKQARLSTQTNGLLDLPTGPNGQQYQLDTFLKASQAIQNARNGNDNLAYIKAQVNLMLNSPSLVMLVNPNDFALSYTKIISSGTPVRKGYVIEHWGDQLPTLSLSGQTGAFLTTRQDGSGGLTSNSEISGSYLNLMELFRFFQSNARIRNLDGSIALVGSIHLFFDDRIYEGHIDSFNLSEEANVPFSISYNLNFIVHYIYDSKRRV